MPLRAFASLLLIAIVGCGPQSESPRSPVTQASRGEERANSKPSDATAEAVPAAFETVEELLTPQAIRASLRDRFGDDCQVKVHEIAAVDREGERPGIRVYGEAVVELELADQRLLTMVVLMQYGKSRPVRWQDGFLSPCLLEPEIVQVTKQPTDEELAWFRGACRTVRAATMAGAVDEPVTFRYGYVNPERTWPKAGSASPSNARADAAQEHPDDDAVLRHRRQARPGPEHLGDFEEGGVAKCSRDEKAGSRRWRLI